MNTNLTIKQTLPKYLIWRFGAGSRWGGQECRCGYCKCCCLRKYQKITSKLRNQWVIFLEILGSSLIFMKLPPPNQS